MVAALFLEGKKRYHQPLINFVPVNFPASSGGFWLIPAVLASSRNRDGNGTDRRRIAY